MELLGALGRRTVAVGRQGIPRRIPWAKRAFDLVVLVCLIPLLALPLLFFALLVFLDSPGPVIYRARRLGLGGRPFLMLKFRTMRTGARGAAVTPRNDPRITPLGSFLRSTRLDELPQLWNVVRGEMRLVGPRPEDEEFVVAHRQDYERILSVPPGVTGPTQLRFTTAEADLLADSDDPAAHYARAVLPSKVASDLGYANRHSVPGDLVIIGKTLLLPFRFAAARIRSFGAHHRPLASAYALSGGIAIVLLIAFAFTWGPAR
jgi:lipopolysaccharide/colanic/teichoic acid biosynthesis glycosyltransferase